MRKVLIAVSVFVFTAVAVVMFGSGTEEPFIKTVKTADQNFTVTATVTGATAEGALQVTVNTTPAMVPGDVIEQYLMYCNDTVETLHLQDTVVHNSTNLVEVLLSKSLVPEEVFEEAITTSILIIIDQGGEDDAMAVVTLP